MGDGLAPNRPNILSPGIFIKDKIEKGEIEVIHQPTQKMWSDILTKPNSGIL